MNITQVLRMSVQDTIPNASTTIRSALLTSTQPLIQNKIFLNPVVEDFPELKENYLAAIKEPMSISVIKYKLNSKTCKYQLLYEPLHDLCLMTYNCRLFNPSNDFLDAECTNFEKVIIDCVNSFLFKINCKKISTYAEFAETLLKPLSDIVVIESKQEPLAQPQTKQKTFEKGTATQQTIQDCIQKLTTLTQENQQKLIKMLVFELNSMDFDPENDQKCILQFDVENNPKQFWWFYENVLKCVQEETGEMEEEGEEVQESAQ
ncbi:Bromodomain-containing_protein [Hexamita inflata]|uniref:Bromodomain-containing protein n=1 Tax=Hexamita inflata TaxID=28002 RepID=A0AA86R9I4_9EUKA|nr:Bromodomain-containing protein [Hexamita inflata]